MIKQVLLLVILICFSSSFPLQDELFIFPDVGVPQNRMFSGYLDIGNKKQLHYVLAESENDSRNDPLFIWLEGGPGCSSLSGIIDGMGSYSFDENGKTSKNKNTWQKLANILYLESPSGVGFSKHGDSFKSNDILSSIENYNALMKFFELFEDYKGKDLYIGGSSYGGIYAPYLASKILDHNFYAPKDKEIKLKGVILSNPVVDWSIEGESEMIEHAYSFNLYTPKQRENYLESCINKEFINKSDCKKAKESIYDSIKGTNVYDVKGDCFPPEVPTGRTPTGGKIDYLLPLLEPCFGTKAEFSLSQYFNRLDVKKAFNLDQNHKFVECNFNVRKNYEFFDDRGSFYIMPRLLSNNIRVWVFSGENDLVMPYTGTLKWIKKLNLRIKNHWRDWGYEFNPESAGNVIDFDGLTFVKVKNAGHLVPTYLRAESYKIFEAFINNKPLF